MPLQPLHVQRNGLRRRARLLLCRRGLPLRPIWRGAANVPVPTGGCCLVVLYLATTSEKASRSTLTPCTTWRSAPVAGTAASTAPTQAATITSNPPGQSSTAATAAPTTSVSRWRMPMAESNFNSRHSDLL